MRPFDPAAPLIVIHVPKTAGTSVKAIFKGWYGKQLHLHYKNAATGKMPVALTPQQMAADPPPVIYGHFNATRAFGIQDYYPGVKQFVTILRDPFDTAVSGLFYWAKVTSGGKDAQIPHEQAVRRLRKRPSAMLHHFPRDMTLDNYKEFIERDFIHIGITEDLPTSLGQIARKLGQSFDPTQLEHRNVTDHPRQFDQELRDHFEERHPLDYAVYRYAKACVQAEAEAWGA